MTAGAIVLDVSAGNEASLPRVLAAALRVERGEKAGARLPGIFVCGAVDGEEAQAQGAAAAAKAAVLLSRGTIEQSQTIVAVDARRCRACGTCEKVCPFAAIAVVVSAEIRDGLCQGCGICVAHCPSGALSQSGCSDSMISASLEAVLA